MQDRCGLMETQDCILRTTISVNQVISACVYGEECSSVSLFERVVLLEWFGGYLFLIAQQLVYEELVRTAESISGYVNWHHITYSADLADLQSGGDIDVSGEGALECTSRDTCGVQYLVRELVSGRRQWCRVRVESVVVISDGGHVLSYGFALGDELGWGVVGQHTIGDWRTTDCDGQVAWHSVVQDTGWGGAERGKYASVSEMTMSGVLVVVRGEEALGQALHGERAGDIYKCARDYIVIWRI
ncbi:hypothetical protein Tco_0115076 [Tanacetum coccineum]